ncbi:hypothetical protein BGZ65_000864 [Modicella reniformis]|uniref:Glutathione S-transferase n=1 Tax=Modicella reniformis TaxID=1440133 RepID=A0A9P6LTL3_9FUNG|nr:hypothetical protein BGZ65_000864 [Modicella reniformis]
MAEISSTPSAADLAQDSSNVHNLTYFSFHGLAGCIRTALVLSNEPYKFTNIGFAEWQVQKQLTPFGHVPVLREETKSGKILELAEISTIEQFLANRTGLLGKDFWEENLIKMYLSSTHGLITFLFQTSVQSPKDDRPAFLERFKKSNLPEWIKFHEKHLKANGSNGHYVGDKLSIADIKTASVIEHLVRLCGDDVQISEELTPAIMAVKTNLEKNPAYVEWCASEQYQKLTASNLGFFGF